MCGGRLCKYLAIHASAHTDFAQICIYLLLLLVNHSLFTHILSFKQGHIYNSSFFFLFFFQYLQWHPVCIFRDQNLSIYSVLKKVQEASKCRYHLCPPGMQDEPIVFMIYTLSVNYFCLSTSDLGDCGCLLKQHSYIAVEFD